MINGFVKGQSLKISQPLIVSDTIDYLEMNFSFQTGDWDETSKWAHFRQGETVWDILLENNRITSARHLNLSEGKWEVYLHGTKAGQRITTEIAELIVKKTGVLAGKPLPEIPLSAAEQIDQKAQRAEDKADRALAEIRQIAKKISQN